MRNDSEKFQPLGPAKRTTEAPAPPQVVKKQTAEPQPPLHINDMDMIKRDFNNAPPPWGIFNCRTSWEVFYYPVVRFKHPSFRGGDEG